MYDITPTTRTKSLANFRIGLFGLLISLFCTNCTPVYRFERLLQKHPYLAKLYAKDSVVVKSYEDLDTLFVFSSEKDTLFFNDTKLFRTSDTIRLVRTFKPCTTYVSKNISIPEKTIERERWKVHKQDTWVILLLVVIFIAVLLKK
jgi:hypothetical protein